MAKSSGAAALNVLASPLFNANRGIILERAAASRLPAIYQWPEMAEEGGLMPTVRASSSSSGRRTGRNNCQVGRALRAYALFAQTTS
jgi:hypothetical protein